MTKAQLRAAARRVAEQLISDEPLTMLPTVGLKEVNRMFGTAGHTAYQWKNRGLLPNADAPLSGNPAWRLPRIYTFAEATNRKIVWDPWGLYAPGDAGVGGPELAADDDAEGEAAEVE